MSLCLLSRRCPWLEIPKNEGFALSDQAVHRHRIGLINNCLHYRSVSRRYKQPSGVDIGFTWNWEKGQLTAISSPPTFTVKPADLASAILSIFSRKPASQLILWTCFFSSHKPSLVRTSMLVFPRPGTSITCPIAATSHPLFFIALAAHNSVNRPRAASTWFPAITFRLVSTPGISPK